jgi:hypothetical protein
MNVSIVQQNLRPQQLTHTPSSQLNISKVMKVSQQRQEADDNGNNEADFSCFHEMY